MNVRKGSRMKGKLEGISSLCVLFSETSALQQYFEGNVWVFASLLIRVKKLQSRQIEQSRLERNKKTVKLQFRPHNLSLCFVFKLITYPLGREV